MKSENLDILKRSRELKNQNKKQLTFNHGKYAANETFFYFPFGYRVAGMRTDISTSRILRRIEFKSQPQPKFILILMVLVVFMNRRPCFGQVPYTYKHVRY